MLLCLGLDFRSGGFIDRAHEAFKEVLRLDPGNRYALMNLQKLHEEQHQWQEAYQLQQQVAALDPAADPTRTNGVLAFLENAIGVDAQRAGDARRGGPPLPGGDRARPARRAGIPESRRPAARAGRRRRRRSPRGSAPIEVSPGRAYLAFDRLQATYPLVQAPERFAELCRRPHRRLSAGLARTAGARATPRQTRGSMREAFELLLQALSHNPHALLIHQAMWDVAVAPRLPARADRPLSRR